VPGEPVADDEVLMRRIPPGSTWFEPPDRLTSANFKLQLKKHELGVSVYCQSIVSEVDLLASPDSIPGSFVVTATAGDVRRLTSGSGEPLRLDVMPADDEDNPGHAEIRGPEPGKLSPSASKGLRDLFARSLSKG
jgi:hypothetical protein